MKRVLLIASILSLAACGTTEALKPPAGDTLPPKPYGATAAPSAEDLSKATAQERPSRNIDVLIRSQERQGNEFDLPPN